MDKTNPPTTFGAFKPVGHTVIAFRSDADMQVAVNALIEQGFAHAALVRYTPAEMTAQVEAELKTASPLASFGYELDLVKEHSVLAQAGCSFLVVHAPTTRWPNASLPWRVPPGQSRDNTMEPL